MSKLLKLAKDHPFFKVLSKKYLGIMNNLNKYIFSLYLIYLISLFIKILGYYDYQTINSLRDILCVNYMCL